MTHGFGAALAAFILAAAPAALAQTQAARPAAPACFQVQPSSQSYVPIRMQLTAEHVDEDPTRVWTNWELWNPFSPQRTAIWTGAVAACGGGEIVVSQIVNRQCSSATECPARVVLRQAGSERVLLDYRQVCTTHGTFELQGNLGALRACGVATALRPG